MNRGCLRLGVILAVVLIGCVSRGWAQDNASVRGTVVDPLGARVSGAVVKLLAGEKVVKEGTSDAQGGFAFEGVAEGRYRIEASATGFQMRITDPMFVGGGAQLSIEVALPIEPLGESVSVTAAATELLPSQIGAPVTVIDLETLGQLGKPDVLEALRLVPGVSLVQAGARGGVTSIFVRGGNSNFNKVLIDGISANDIGGGVDLSQYSVVGVERVEALRDPNSIVFGSDALSGVVSLTTRRGSTPTPEGIFSIDGGNLGTNRESAGVGGTVGRVDYFSEFAHFGTDNDLPNNEYSNKTYAGRFGVALGHNTDVSGTVRWIDPRFETPNAFSFYGTPDDAFQTFNVKLYGVSAQTQWSNRWQSTVRYAALDQESPYENPTISGNLINGFGYGNVVTIDGANGYSVTGQGIMDFGPSPSSPAGPRGRESTARPHLKWPATSASLAAPISNESKAIPVPTSTEIRMSPGRTSAVWVEGSGTLWHRLSATAGVGYAHNEVFESAYSPRLSVAAYLRTPMARILGRHTSHVQRGQGHQGARGLPGQQFALHAVDDDARRHGARRQIRHRAGRARTGPERGRWHRTGDVAEPRARAGGLLRQRVLRPRRVGEPEPAAEVRHSTRSGGGGSERLRQLAVVHGEGCRDVSRRPGRPDALRRVLHSRRHGDDRVAVERRAHPVVQPGVPRHSDRKLQPASRTTALPAPAEHGSLFAGYVHGRATVAVSGYFAGKADDSTFLGGSTSTSETPCCCQTKI